MNARVRAENIRDFNATCSGAKIIETEKVAYKHVRMFGDKTLIFWKGSGRISVRTGHVTL